MHKKVSVLLSFILICMLMIPMGALAASDHSVKYTADSKAQPGCSMTVDLEAMSGYDARVYNAFLEGTATYVWKKNGTVIPDAVTGIRFFSDSDIGQTYQVIVTCDDMVIEGEPFTVEAPPAPSVPEGPAIEAPEIKTTSLPKATAGKEYYCKLKCTDPDAVFSEYYNPGKANDLGKTGLYVTQHGELEGTPKKAGKYTFTLMASGEGGEGYMTFTLTVEEAVEESKTEDNITFIEDPEKSETDIQSEPLPETSEKIDSEVSDMVTTVGPLPETGVGAEEESGGMPWWAIALIAVAAAGIGMGVTLLLLKYKKK